MPLNPVEVTGGLAIGEGVGGAIEAVVEPRLQDFKNKQWAKHQDKPLDPADAAAAEQQGYAGKLVGLTDASFGGIDGARYLALRYLAATAPGTPELLELWRRDKIGPDLVRVGLKKAGLMDEFVDAVLDLFTGRLDPAVIATAIQRGIMADPGFLPVGPPTAAGKVAAFPVSPLDPLAEAKAHGIDEERLFVETAIVGLPLSLQQAASAYFREIIELPDFERAVSEGNTRNEWGPAALEQARQILTAGEYVERQLRGFTDRKGRLADTGKHGMSTEDSDKLYEVLGRSPSIHTLVTGLARGGTYPGSYANVPQPYRAEIQRSNIREEWSEVVYAARYNYPSPFVLRGLAEAGDLGNAAAVEQILLEIGWKPSLAASVSKKWQPSGAKADPHVAKAQTQLWTAIHRSYVADESAADVATTTLGRLGVDAAAVPTILRLWDAEKSLITKQLSPADLRKAWQQGDVNAATGLPWTRDEVLARMLELGYDADDANSYLNIPYKG